MAPKPEFVDSLIEQLFKWMKKSKETLRANYIDPAIENGLIKMTLPDYSISESESEKIWLDIKQQILNCKYFQIDSSFSRTYTASYIYEVK